MSAVAQTTAATLAARSAAKPSSTYEQRAMRLRALAKTTPGAIFREFPPEDGRSWAFAELVVYHHDHEAAFALAKAWLVEFERLQLQLNCCRWEDLWIVRLSAMPNEGDRG